MSPLKGTSECPLVVKPDRRLLLGLDAEEVLSLRVKVLVRDEAQGLPRRGEVLAQQAKDL